MIMKIVILVSYTYPFVGSGIGQVALLQAEGLEKLDQQVILVSSNIPSTKKKFKKNGVLHIKLVCSNFLDKFHIPVPLFFLSGEVMGHIKNADIVHSHDMLYPHSLQAALIAKIYRKKFVLTQHVGLVQYKSKLINLLQWIVAETLGRATISLSDKVIAVNEDVRLTIKTNPFKTYTLLNGVDRMLFGPVSEGVKKLLRKKYELPVNKKIVLFVGRLVPKKGYKILFEARDKNYLILFAGSGIVPDSMKGEKTKTKFLGNLPQDKLSEIYKLSDIFVLPSRDEGLPLSIQEALVSGLPVITTKNPGYEKYFNNSQVIYSERIPSKIKKTILKVLSDKVIINDAREFALNNRERYYSWEDNVGDLLKIYKNLS